MKGSKTQVTAHTAPQADRLTHARHRKRAARRFSLPMNDVGRLTHAGRAFAISGTASGAGCGASRAAWQPGGRHEAN